MAVLAGLGLCFAKRLPKGGGVNVQFSGRGKTVYGGRFDESRLVGEQKRSGVIGVFLRRTGHGMLSVRGQENWDGLYGRRELIRIGGLSLAGLSWSQLSAFQRASGHSAGAGFSGPASKSCVFIFLFGGPSQVDMWDMKPAAPMEIRGEFRPIATSAPEIQICEHMPLLAGQMHQMCLVRSMHHRMPVHGPACSEVYSGRPYPLPPVTDEARREDWPSLTSLVTRFGQEHRGVPSAIVLPWHSQFRGQSGRIAGQTGGRMGEQFSPFLLSAALQTGEFDSAELTLPESETPERLRQRFQLLGSLERKNDRNPADHEARGPERIASYQRHQETALSMLSSGQIGRAVDLSRESAGTRERYGRSAFGSSLLAARRLVEAGVPLITVNWYDDSFNDKVSPHWDQHNHIFPTLRDRMLPVFDRAFSAFIEDLAGRELLSSTLVTATGEFGRTPIVGQFTQNAMTEKSGRDHWPHAFTLVMAGGGIRGGQVYGSTDKQGGQVRDNPVTPADLTATILQHLNVNPNLEYWDPFQQQQQRLTEGHPIAVERFV